jgi:hypothetical protein
MNVWIAAARLLYCFDFTEDKVNNPYPATAYYLDYLVLNHFVFISEQIANTFARPIRLTQWIFRS